ncbi:MAG: hypothetical protein WAN14_18055, partial [Candidatus Acidiferrales bacterium]
HAAIEAKKGRYLGSVGSAGKYPTFGAQIFISRQDTARQVLAHAKTKHSRTASAAKNHHR